MKGQEPMTPRSRVHLATPALCHRSLKINIHCSSLKTLNDPRPKFESSSLAKYYQVHYFEPPIGMLHY